MSELRTLSLEEALSLAAAFAAAPSQPVTDRTLPSGEIVPKCFSGSQLANFLRSEEAGNFKASCLFPAYIVSVSLLHISEQLLSGLLVQFMMLMFLPI
jgi:hypothetical protein